MCVTVGVTRLNYRQLVSMFADMRKVAWDQQSACATSPETSSVWSQKPHLAIARVNERCVPGKRLAGVRAEFRFVVEGVHMAGSTIHHQKDAGLCLRSKMQWLSFGRVSRIGKEAIIFQQ